MLAIFCFSFLDRTGQVTIDLLSYLALNFGIHLLLQDGSTALMCACEHGYGSIVKHLLTQPDCDSTLEDNVSLLENPHSLAIVCNSY